jgi:hypothetical protein
MPSRNSCFEGEPKLETCLLEVGEKSAVSQVLLQIASDSKSAEPPSREYANRLRSQRFTIHKEAFETAEYSISWGGSNGGSMLSFAALGPQPYLFPH